MVTVLCPFIQPNSLGDMPPECATSYSHGEGVKCEQAASRSDFSAQCAFSKLAIYWLATHRSFSHVITSEDD